MSVASRTTIAVSLAAHVLVAGALVVVPLFAQVPLPAPSRPIDAYIAAAVYEAVPAPRPPGQQAPAAVADVLAAAPVSDAAVAAAPIEAPTTIGVGDPLPMPVPQGFGVGVPGGIGISESVGSAVSVPPDAPPPPPVARPLRVGGDVRAPRKLHHVAPVYPAVAGQARISGVVILEATIAPTGDVVNVTVLRSVPLLDGAAVAAVRQWRYDPPRLNGQPVAVLLTVTVQFAQ